MFNICLIIGSWSNERIGYMMFENNSYDKLNNDFKKSLVAQKLQENSIKVCS